MLNLRSIAPWAWVAFKPPPRDTLLSRSQAPQSQVTSRWQLVIFPTTAIFFAGVSYFTLRILWQEQGSGASFSQSPPKSPGLVHAFLPFSADGTSDAEPYTQALAPLLNFGLIQHIPGRGYSIHALVQWWRREQFDIGQRQTWAMEGIRLVQYALQAENSRADPEFMRHVVNHLIEIAGVLTSGENYLYAAMRELMVSLVLAVNSIEKLVGRLPRE